MEDVTSVTVTAALTNCRESSFVLLICRTIGRDQSSAARQEIRIRGPVLRAIKVALRGATGGTL